MLSVIMPYAFSIRCPYAECPYTECDYTVWHYAEWHYAEWHYAECRGTNKESRHCLVQ